MNNYREALFKEARKRITTARRELNLAIDHLERIETMPEACQCGPAGWHGAVTRICDNFQPSDEDPKCCAACEHNKACHEAKE